MNPLIPPGDMTFMPTSFDIGAGVGQGVQMGRVASGSAYGELLTMANSV
jgi:hypothetical protein